MYIKVDMLEFLDAKHVVHSVLVGPFEDGDNATGWMVEKEDQTHGKLEGQTVNKLKFSSVSDAVAGLTVIDTTTRLLFPVMRQDALNKRNGTNWPLR